MWQVTLEFLFLLFLPFWYGGPNSPDAGEVQNLNQGPLPITRSVLNQYPDLMVPLEIARARMHHAHKGVPGLTGISKTSSVYWKNSLMALSTEMDAREGFARQLVGRIYQRLRVLEIRLTTRQAPTYGLFLAVRSVKRGLASLLENYQPLLSNPGSQAQETRASFLTQKVRFESEPALTPPKTEPWVVLQTQTMEASALLACIPGKNLKSCGKTGRELFILGKAYGDLAQLGVRQNQTLQAWRHARQIRALKLALNPRLLGSQMAFGEQGSEPLKPVGGGDR